MSRRCWTCGRFARLSWWAIVTQGWGPSNWIEAWVHGGTVHQVTTAAPGTWTGS